MYYMMSIHSNYAYRILNGEKTVEIRRSHVNMKNGDCVAIYATQPTGQVVGFFTVNEVIYDTPECLWQRYHSQTCILKKEYIKYSAGTVICNDLFDCIDKKSEAKEDTYFYDYTPITTQNYKKLDEIDIHIPQSYVHISEDFFNRICNIEGKEHREC